MSSFEAHLPPPVRVPLTVVPEHPCSYLPDRLAQSRAFAADALPAELYHDFMDAGFRRSGTIFYQPICRGCRACIPIRIPADRFIASKSQRRCWRRNQDLTVTIGPLTTSDEKFELYSRYQSLRHHADPDDGRAAFESFLYESPVETLELCHRDPAGRLLAVGICDVCSRSLSSVYFYFEPTESRRGLGTFGALLEIELARQRRIPHYYLGFWVGGCRTMDYKTAFRPYELLGADGLWREEKEEERPNRIAPQV